MASYSNFKNIFPVSKTVCVPLIPTEQTKLNIVNNSVIEKARKLEETSVYVHELMDEIYKRIITESMAEAGEAEEFWKGAVSDILRLREEREMTKDKEAKKAIDKRIADVVGFADEHVKMTIQNHPLYGQAAGPVTSFIKDTILPMAEGRGGECLEAVRFASTMKNTFEDFQKTRKKTILAATSFKTKKNSVPFRANHENLFTFIDNIEEWRRLTVKYPELKARLAALLEENPVLGLTPADIFGEGGYHRFLTKEGVALYNSIINGWVMDGVNHKGLRMAIVEVIRRDTGKTNKKAHIAINELKKQILLDEDTFSFRPTAFESASEIMKATASFLEDMEEGNIIGRGREILDCLDIYDIDSVTIGEKARRRLSNFVFKSWRVADGGLRDLAEKRFPKNKAQRKKLADAKFHSLADLDEAFRLAGLDQEVHKDGLAGIIAQLYNEGVNKYYAARDVIGKIARNGHDFKKDKADNAELSAAMRDLKEARDVLAMLMPDEPANTDEQLYYDLSGVLDTWNRIIPLMNGARNYCTQKPFSREKSRLWFDNDIFLGGWSAGQHGDNFVHKGGMLILRDGAFHFVAFQHYDKEQSRALKLKPLNFSSFALQPGCAIARMAYTDNLDAGKHLPKNIMTEKEMARQGVSDDVRELIRSGKYKEGGEALHTAIRFALRGLRESPAYSRYSLPQDAPESYNSWKEFSDRVTDGSYMMELRDINADVLDRLEKEGRVYVFRVSGVAMEHLYKGEYTSKMLCMHLYDALLNRHDTQLRGKGRVFFRPASADPNAVTHRKGSKLINKRDCYGEPVPGRFFREFNAYLNHGLSKEKLSRALKDYLADGQPWNDEFLAGKGRVWIREATFDLHEYRRYTTDHYELQLSVIINATAGSSAVTPRADLDMRFRQWMQENPRRPILGINRGENNLIYATLVDADGKIIEQRGLNVLAGFNYHSQIGDRERDMKELQRKWLDSGKIRELKEGYLSVALAEVVSMAFENEAVIAMEDLDVPFIRDRGDLGSVYRKFKTMLLNKLRWYIPDKTRPWEAWQLTCGAVPGDHMTRNGIVMFVNPWACSATDPFTGFRNALPFFEAGRSADSKRGFLGSFTEVKRLPGSDYEISYDERKFGVPVLGQAEWTVTTAGTRIITQTSDNGVRSAISVKPSEMMDAALDGIVKDGNLVDALMTLKGEKLDKAFDAIRLTMQMRNCDIGANVDRFQSPVKGGLDTTLGKRGAPATCDSVTAYNIALKARWMLVNGKSVIGKDEWLGIQRKPF